MKKLHQWFRKYFIPHEHNDHEPHFFRHESMLFIFLLVILVELGFLAQVFLVFDKTKFLAAVLPGVLTEIANNDRRNYDAPPLIVSDLLTKAAIMKAEDMARNGYFAHTSPDGKSPWYWLSQVGYKYSTAGENLAVNFYDSDDVARAWMNSPTHKANIIKKEYTEIGIGVARGMYQGEDTIFVAQFFGKPLLASAPVPTVPINSNVVASAPTPAPVKKPTAPTTQPKSPTLVAPKPVPIESPIEKPSSETLASNDLNPVPTQTTVLGDETPRETNVFYGVVKSIKSFFNKVLTSPSHSVALVYAGLIFFILIALLVVLFVRSEIGHPIIMARGLALITVIVVLLYVNIQVLSIETLVPTDNQNISSFIAS